MIRTLLGVVAALGLGRMALAQVPLGGETRKGSLLLLDAIDGVRKPRHGMPKVVGGGLASPGDDPWQVALLAPNLVQFCGGSLIAPGWVLTAAHCVDRGTTPEQLSVLTGTTDLGVNGAPSRVLGIAVHELWETSTHDFDIAVLRIEGNHAGMPIRLMTADEEARLLIDGTSLRTTGWGATSEGGAEQTQLRAVMIPFQPTAICNRRQSYGGSVTENMLCAGKELGGLDACQGDSGGPLTIRTTQGPLLAGAVSWGEGCGLPYKFGVYTRLSRLTGWLRLKMNPVP